MQPLPPDASDEQILDVVRRWVDHLAHERYDDALQVVDVREPWTSELLETVIRNYGSIDPMYDGSTWRVTPLETASGGRPRPRHDVDRCDDGRAFVWFDLPLNGSWSDLTALFDVVPKEDGLHVVLDDVHVM
jgi:hypothetical protein